MPTTRAHIDNEIKATQMVLCMLHTVTKYYFYEIKSLVYTERLGRIPADVQIKLNIK